MLPSTFGPEPPGLWVAVRRRQSEVLRGSGDSAGSLDSLALAPPHRRRTVRRRRHAVHTTTEDSRWGSLVERSLEPVDGSSCASSSTALSLHDDDGPPRDRGSRWQDIVCAITEAEAEAERDREEQGQEEARGGLFSLHYSKIGDEGGRLLAAAIEEQYPEQSRDPFALPSAAGGGRGGGGTIPFGSLLLGDCELSVAGVAPLSAAIRKRGFTGQGLDALHLGNNPDLGDSGIVAMAQMLPPKFVGSGDLSTLRVLYLEHTGCRDEGLQALAKALHKMPRLEELQLSDNPEIGQPGWHALGAALPSLPVLRELRASGCRGMGCAGVTALTSKLPTMQGEASLEELYIDGCNIGVEGARALKAVLKYCGRLTRLIVRENPIGPAGRAALESAATKGKPGSKWTWGEGHPIETPLRLSYAPEPTPTAAAAVAAIYAGAGGGGGGGRCEMVLVRSVE
jgi:hypothetical protein